METARRICFCACCQQRPLNGIFFSPTGTTQKVLESIAKGIAVENVGQVNLTLPEGTQQTTPPFSDELVIIGAPVYGGASVG